MCILLYVQIFLDLTGGLYTIRNCLNFYFLLYYYGVSFCLDVPDLDLYFTTTWKNGILRHLLLLPLLLLILIEVERCYFSWMNHWFRC